jgi:uncharacterized membrane protein
MSATYDYKLEKVKGDPLAPEEFGASDEEHELYENYVTLSFLGFIGGLILGILLLTFGIVDLSRYSKNLPALVALILCVVLLLAATCIIVSGMAFVNLSVKALHQNINYKEQGVNAELSMYSIGGIVACVFGFILLLLTFLVMKSEARKIAPAPMPMSSAGGGS